MAAYNEDNNYGDATMQRPNRFSHLAEYSFKSPVDLSNTK
jgi:hypothetical protein